MTETATQAIDEAPIATAIRERAEDWPENALDPQACAAAVLAVLEMHKLSRMLAWPLPERFGEGCCAYCSRYTLIAEFRDERGRIKHDHGVSPAAWCVTCPEDIGAYPCPTVRAIADALGIDA